MLLIYSCKNYQRNDSHRDVSLVSIRKGEGLAQKYCQSCHLLPDPSLLDSKSWERGILPAMGPRLGIFNYGTQIYPYEANDLQLADTVVYPTKQLLSFTEWQHIIDYYTSVSPDSLPAHQRKEPAEMVRSIFTAVSPEFTYEEPGTSFVKINPADTLHPLVVSDVVKKEIYFFDRQMKIKDSARCGGPVVDINFSKDELFVCNIGILNPNNGKSGKGQRIWVEPSGKMRLDSTIIFDGLRRPVQITRNDLNNDGRLDYLVCEFGNILGELSWMENLGNDKFQKHSLRKAPGALKAYVNDYNHDGKLDIWVLFAQGDESIFLFTNKGNGNFETKQVLRFPSVYGSSYFELDDFNKDGFDDIVYTCGDNADYSPVLKPYHGVYIFLNDGKNNFSQKYFYPINGCYKAIAKDFDGDGDLDIAAISFFADYKHHPEEGFIYLEQNGTFDFTPYSLPESGKGRWLTMDAGDFDNDGRIDLILGNFSIKPPNIPNAIDWKEEPPFLILKNTGGRPVNK